MVRAAILFVCARGLADVSCASCFTPPVLQGACLFLIWLTLQAGLMISPVPDAATGNAFLISLSVANIVLLISPMLLGAVVGLQMIPVSFRQRVTALLRRYSTKSLLFSDPEAVPRPDMGHDIASSWSSSNDRDEDDAVSRAPVPTSVDGEPFAALDRVTLDRVTLGDVELTGWHVPATVPAPRASPDHEPVDVAGLLAAGRDVAGQDEGPGGAAAAAVAASWELLMEVNPLHAMADLNRAGATSGPDMGPDELPLSDPVAASSPSERAARRRMLEMTDEIAALKAEIAALKSP